MARRDPADGPLWGFFGLAFAAAFLVAAWPLHVFLFWGDEQVREDAVGAFVRDAREVYRWLTAGAGR